MYDKVGFSVPTISSLLKIKKAEIQVTEQIKSGVLLGVLTGILIVIVSLIFKSSIPQEFIDLQNKIKITPIARFAYGGFTEELLIRYGFMTFVVWVVFKITKKLNNATYWIGISLAAVSFSSCI